jgi:hypothetical protein
LAASRDTCPLSSFMIVRASQRHFAARRGVLCGSYYVRIKMARKTRASHSLKRERRLVLITDKSKFLVSPKMQKKTQVYSSKTKYTETLHESPPCSALSDQKVQPMLHAPENSPISLMLIEFVGRAGRAAPSFFGAFANQFKQPRSLTTIAQAPIIHE